MRNTLLGILAAVCLWAGAISVSPDAEAHRVQREELFYYPSGKFLKQATLGYAQAGASLAWLRCVQYYGKHVRSDLQFDMMYHLCDITTDLDPRFEEPYTFGAFVLMTEGRRPEDGMKLLEKGRENNPQSWKIFFESGFIYYIGWKDYDKAAEYLAQAARMPGAPEYVSRFAAFVTYRAGEIETSILFWQELAQRTNNPELREKAIKQIEELEAQLAEEKSG